ncbi:MAG TPA: mechanosensitive ion channel family protein [Bryobacteraceae bacterium]|nr:mechanosensitive ion channel family protein [Bryobacteraceae bacterium]
MSIAKARAMIVLKLLIGKILPAALLASVLLVAAPEPPQPKDPRNRETPQSAVLGFLDANRAHDYARAAKFLDLRQLPATQRKAGPELARKLGLILNRDAEFDVAELSRDPDGGHTDGLPADRERVDTFQLNGQTVDIELQRVTLRNKLSIWLFSSDSVQRIPKLAQLTSDSPIEKYLPVPLVAWSFLDTALWRWIALGLLAIVSIAIAKIVCPLAFRLILPLLKRIWSKSDWTELNGFIAPLEVLLASAVLRIGMEWIDPSALVRPYLERTLSFLFFLGFAWLFMRTVDVIIRRLNVFLRARHQSFSYSVLPLASRVLKITILLLMIAALLSSWGYNTTTLVAGLGVGGIAIALAAQKTIENFFGGVSVVSDRPVAVGEFCKFGDRMGTVEDIGLRSTRIRTLDRTLVTVPNGQFSSMTLENFDRRDKMLFHFMLNVRRDTKPDQVRELLTSISKMLAEHPKLEKSNLPIHFNGVGTYSLDLEIFAYVLTKDGDEFNRIQQDLYLRILDAVEAAGTALALPTQANISYAPQLQSGANGNHDHPEPVTSAPTPAR